MKDHANTMQRTEEHFKKKPHKYKGQETRASLSCSRTRENSVTGHRESQDRKAGEAGSNQSIWQVENFTLYCKNYRKSPRVSNS